MPWDNELTSELPPERPDEPAHLRQDILDELSDHLNCALTRESRRTEDEPTARKAVLARFGNPCSLARQLWFDALKESIMKQRTLLATNLLLAVVCIAVGVIAWTSMQQGKAFQQTLLDKLNAAPPVPPANQNNTELSIWTHGSFKIAEDTEDGPPAAGYTVTLRGSAFEPGKMVQQEAKTNDQGEITFGPIRPSAYQLKITDPAGLTLSREMVIYPGNKPTRTIVWPKTIETVQKPFQFDNVPESLAEEDLILTCRLTPYLPARDSHGGEWVGTTQRFLIRSDGQSVIFDYRNDPQFQRGSRPVELPRQKYFLRRSYYDYQSGLPLLAEARYGIQIGSIFSPSWESEYEPDEEKIGYTKMRLTITPGYPPNDQYDHSDLAKDHLLIRIPPNPWFEQVAKKESEATPDSEKTNKPDDNTP